MQKNKDSSSLRRWAAHASVALSLSLALGACASAPKKVLLIPVVDVPTPAELDYAQASVKQCLHVEAFRLDDEKSAPSDLGYAVSCGCMDQIHDFSVLESRRTRDTTAAWVVYASMMKSASDMGTQAVIDLRRSEKLAAK